MPLSTQQLQTLKAAILADPTLNAYPNTDDGNFDLAKQKLNIAASPAFIVWKTNVSLTEIGRAMDGQETSNLTTANTSRLQVRAAYLTGGENAALASTRTFYDQVFSVGGVTRANLLALYKRQALLIEKIFATGTGSDASPATMTYEGEVSPTDVALARNS